ncbi:MAG: hypothetical protein KGJ62_15440 [Armatimonadetes bacterium]|nr:hypothetical protein [Armatimonadota bacterium]MDE2207483.1 hypothetical protein [Armatimonadota bacterium]
MNYSTVIAGAAYDTSTASQTGAAITDSLGTPVTLFLTPENNWFLLQVGRPQDGGWWQIVPMAPADAWTFLANSQPSVCAQAFPAGQPA